MDREANILLDKRQIFFGLLLVSATFFLLHISGMILRYKYGFNNFYGLIPVFNLDREYNLPTIYSAFLFFMISVMLWVVYSLKKVNRFYWLLSSMLFLFLSLDEVIQIHERFIEPMRAILDTGGVFYFAWIIPYLLGCAVIAAVLYPITIQMTGEMKKLFAVSLLIYFCGAVGLEMLSGYYLDTLNNGRDFWYSIIVGAEELLEMIGLTCLIYALITFIGSITENIHVQVVTGENK